MQTKATLCMRLWGVTRAWHYSHENMKRLHAQGRIVQSSPGAVPAYKRYLDEIPGVPLQNTWDDISPASKNERMGYPTQKPLALLERIIKASSNPGDVVLDPYCGCGTAVDAAESTNRQWIGIDITHLAINVIEKRLWLRHPQMIASQINLKGKALVRIYGRPKDAASAKRLAKEDPHGFEQWVCGRLGVSQYTPASKDGGMDGIIRFPAGHKGTQKALVEVKGGKNVGVNSVRALKGVVEKERAAIGLLVCLSAPSNAMRAKTAHAGVFALPDGTSAPKIQVFSLEEWATGKNQPRIPNHQLALPFEAATPAPQKQSSSQLPLLP